MHILGIESTCDETAVAVVKDGIEVLSNVVASQADLHAEYGGVFPEEACRVHIEKIVPVCKQALLEANLTLSEIDGIAVAHGPGLVGALLIGLNFAKGLAIALEKPLIGVNHLEAHLYATWMSHKEPIPLPALGLVLSGGHTSLIKIENLGKYTSIGQTQDDAIGEAFDKVATLLDLSYPGGPAIEKLAKKGDPNAFVFKAGTVKQSPFDFSFSGIKTAVLYCTKKYSSKIPLLDKRNIAASFQKAAFADVMTKAKRAIETYKLKSVIGGGGVCQNNFLKELFSTLPLPVFWPHSDLTLDNGAMIGGLGGYLFQKSSSLDKLAAEPKLSLV
ncbi:MAG: tRNA (adenosine(37)-N6)-threonylcarbamoyltransferase complex transferase subunit TsaD [Chlamydiia bacterium]|nr:tRNA (adenosine(37)-N6)-threonylcarbamoyltransferase complex transferase subunit TsaD [Chlamydiia bacterium]